jgi:hypothetical protein
LKWRWFGKMKLMDKHSVLDRERGDLPSAAS